MSFDADAWATKLMDKLQEFNISAHRRQVIAEAARKLVEEQRREAVTEEREKWNRFYHFVRGSEPPIVGDRLSAEAAGEILCNEIREFETKRRDSIVGWLRRLAIPPRYVTKADWQDIIANSIEQDADLKGGES